MAESIVTAPNGKKFRITHPDDATEAEKLSFAKKKFAEMETPEPEPAPEEDIALSDIPAEALKNLPDSAAQFGKDLITPFLEPVQTAKTISSLAKGIYQKFTPGEQPDERLVNAVGQFFKDRYGSVSAIKKTVAKDPVGFFADVSTVLSGGGTLAARSPGMVGKIGSVARDSAKYVDPLTAIAKPIKMIASAGAVPASIFSGVGSESLREAARAGAAGGEQAKALRTQMRGKGDITQMVSDARRALSNMSRQKNVEYRAAMEDMGNKNIEPVDFDRIDAVVADVVDAGSYKGQTREKFSGVINALKKQVEEWKDLDPQEFHTAEGMDQLKKRIGDIRDEFDPGSPQFQLADQVYESVTEAIVKEAPVYAKIMGDYHQKAKLVNEIRRELSLPGKTPDATVMRKLQAVMRDNVNTGYGRRRELTEALRDAGADTIMPQIAGQQLSSLEPRGLARLNPAALSVGSTVNPGMSALLALTSPRVVGEAAYLGGRASNVARPVARGLFQTGRIQDQGLLY